MARSGLRKLALGVIGAWTLTLGACGDAPDSATADRGEAGGSQAQSVDEEAMARLRSLPYLGVARETNASLSGVTVYDERRSQPGYNLYTVRSEGAAILLDAEGEVLRRWEGGDYWMRSRLLENGDLLAVGTDGKNKYLARYSWDGELLWKLPRLVHHDVSVRPDGTLLTLARARRIAPDLYPDHVIEDNPILRLSPEGEVLEERSLLDILTTRPGVLTLNIANPKRKSIDLFHSNSVRQIDLPELADTHRLYAPTNVLVSIRHQDRVVIFDWQTSELVWEWGRGEISGPHDAAILETGNLLIFDNGLGRGWSRVIELDPRTEQIVWEYVAPVPTDFYTATRGSNQRLQNGNTLIAESDAAHAFEVTPAGEIVWEFWAPPFQSREGGRWRRHSIVRMYRYSGDWLDELLQRDAARGGSS